MLTGPGQREINFRTKFCQSFFQELLKCYFDYFLNNSTPCRIYELKEECEVQRPLTLNHFSLALSLAEWFYEFNVNILIKLLPSFCHLASPNFSRIHHKFWTSGIQHLQQLLKIKRRSLSSNVAELSHEFIVIFDQYCFIYYIRNRLIPFIHLRALSYFPMNSLFSNFSNMT